MRREIGNQADVPEHQRNGAVCRDREHVPLERTARLRPKPHRIRIREQPIREPRPPQVQDREHAGAATANSVIASEKRLIEVRQSCFSRNRIAEISVPAWPIPIHHTKLMMANPQPIGNVDAPNADALEEQTAHGQHQQVDKARTTMKAPTSHFFGDVLPGKVNDAGDTVRDRFVIVARPENLIRARDR